MRIYHNPRCRKSRETLKIIEGKGVEPEVIRYLDHPPSPAELDMLLKKMKLQPEDIIRKKEQLYKEQFRGKDYSREEWLRILSENPRLIERPIVVEGDRAILGRPPENVKDLL